MEYKGNVDWSQEPQLEVIGKRRKYSTYGKFYAKIVSSNTI